MDRRQDLDARTTYFFNLAMAAEGAGYQARHGGEGLSDNPHACGRSPLEHWAWGIGWRRADDEIEADEEEV